MKWYLHGCPVCHGDLHETIEDERQVQCFLCARVYNKVDIFPLVKPYLRLMSA